MDPARCGGDICVQACAQRPAGGRARHPQPRPRRVRHRRGAVLAARVRPHVVDHPRTVHSAKPVRVQGRNQQPQGRGHRRARPARLGGRRRRPDVADRRHLPGDAAHPDAHRELGPHDAARAGAGDRAAEGQRRAQRTTPTSSTTLDFDIKDAEGHTADRRRRPRPAGVAASTWAASRSCAAATTSPTAPTVSATWTPDCSSSRSCASPRRTFIPMQTAAVRSDALNEYITHTGTARFRLPAGAARGRLVGLLGFDAASADRRDASTSPSSGRSPQRRTRSAT